MRLYRLASALTYALLRLRARLGSDDSLSERTVAPAPRPGPSPLIWLHGASNGELTAARGLIAGLIERSPELRLLVTTNTLTARAMARGWALPRTEVRLAPLDHAPLIARFLDATRPAALVMLENELWPNRLALCAARSIPVLVVGGRLSARSARFWARLPRLAGKLMDAITWLAPQDEASRDRFIALGLDPARLGPILQLKSAVADPAGAAPGLPLPRPLTLLAASTHEGEDEMVLDAFRAARRRHPGLRLLLAPRHPRRRDAIEAAIAARGLAFATRSRGAAPGAQTPVYLADTMGEMALWYRAAGLTFVGGSLVDRGGHTPFEPAAFGSAILHGPHLSNFAPAYGALAAACATRQVTDAQSLGAALAELAGDAAAQADLAARARDALAPFADGVSHEAVFAALRRATGLHLAAP
jgi:3-deoxy-D-manno-octulosonic-acid transferase